MFSFGWFFLFLVGSEVWGGGGFIVFLFVGGFTDAVVMFGGLNNDDDEVWNALSIFFVFTWKEEKRFAKKVIQADT